MSRQLQATIEALNAANEYVNEMAPQLAEDFRSLLGVRIVDASGDSIPLIARLLDPLHMTSSVQVYPRLNENSLALIVKIRMGVKGKKDMFVHQTAIALVGEIKDGVLVDLPPLMPRCTDHAVENNKSGVLNSALQS